VIVFVVVILAGTVAAGCTGTRFVIVVLVIALAGAIAAGYARTRFVIVVLVIALAGAIAAGRARAGRFVIVHLNFADHELPVHNRSFDFDDRTDLQFAFDFCIRT
jgi:general stress protein CsbA